MLVLPYVKGLSEKLGRIYKKHNINLCLKPGQTIRQALVSPKDPIPDQQKQGVIYSIRCDDCDLEYVGQTGQSLKDRKYQHEHSLKNFDGMSALFEHNLKTGQKIDVGKTEIIDSDGMKNTRVFTEAFHIWHRKPMLNRNDGEVLPRIYHQVLRKDQAYKKGGRGNNIHPSSVT